MPQHRIADKRLYGFDRYGREVLVAAKGQPIPEGFEDTRPAVQDVAPKDAKAKAEKPGPVKAAAAKKRSTRKRSSRKGKS